MIPLPRIQRTFTACLILLGACAGMSGMFFFLRWQSDRFDPAAPALLNQSAQVFSQSLLSRKRSLEILRDTLEKTPRLNERERQELLQGTSVRIPHLLANGWVDRHGKFNGWTFDGITREQTLARDRVGPVSLSVGAAQLQENDSPLAVIERADQDLYASRRGGPQVSKVVEWAPAESAFH